MIPQSFIQAEKFSRQDIKTSGSSERTAFIAFIIKGMTSAPRASMATETR